jgi:hypothetical protein
MAYNPDTMSFDVPDTDMIYVSGLAEGTTEEMIATHFGSIGLLKQDKKKGKPKIWLYRDKATNALKVRPLTITSSNSAKLNIRSASHLCARDFKPVQPD